MSREEMWKEFENQLIRETRTPITVSYDMSERMTKSAIKETVAKWKERLEQGSYTIIIPEGTTNKDVFKAIFGYDPATDAVVCNKEDWCGASKPCNYCISNPNNIGKEEEWWNAPYNTESEEKE